MPKEPATYRLNLELLNSKFPEKEIFTIKDIMLIGDMSRPTAQKEFPFAGKYISTQSTAQSVFVASFAVKTHSLWSPALRCRVSRLGQLQLPTGRFQSS